MKNFILICFLSSINFIYTQNTNVQNEIDTDNTQLFYFNHSPLVSNDSKSDFFRPYLAYLQKNGSAYNPIDYMMDSFILTDLYYVYHKNSDGEETPFKGLYEEKYLDSYIKDVFKTTKLPIIEDGIAPNYNEALIVANERATLAYKIDNIPSGTTLNLVFNLKLNSGYIPVKTKDIIIGWEFFNQTGDKIYDNICNDSLSPPSWLDMLYRDINLQYNNSILNETICIPPAASSMKFYIINYYIGDESEMRIDNVKLLNGSTNLIPYGDSTFNSLGFNSYNENNTKWEFYKKYNAPSSLVYLFEDRENSILDVINKSRNDLSSLPSLPDTQIILTLPGINIDYYAENFQIQELENLIEYYINKIDTEYTMWLALEQPGENRDKIKIKGLYLLDEYIKDRNAYRIQPVIDFIKDKLAQKNWKLYGSPYAQLKPECTFATSYSDSIINSVDVVWQQPNSFFLNRNSSDETFEVDREVLRMANTLSSSKKININIESRIKEENEPYGRINDYFDYGDKYGYINYSKVYYDTQGAHYSNCYSNDDEKRIDYDNLYQFIKKARNGVLINNKFETISETDNTKFHNWCGDYSIKTNSFSQSNERLLKFPVTTTAKLYSEFIPIKQGVDYRVDFTPICVPNNNKALIGVIFYDNNDEVLLNLNPNFTNLEEHYQGNYYVYANPINYDTFFNFRAPADAVKFKFYLDKWETTNATFKNIKFYEISQINQNRLIYKYNNSAILKLENKIDKGNYSLKLDEYKFAYTCEKISVRTDINYQLKVSTKEILPIKDLSKQTKALIAIKTFNKEGAKINVPIVGFDGYSGNLDMYYKYIPNIGQVWQEFTQNLSFPSNVASIEVYLYNWYYDNTILFDNFSFQQAGIDNEIPINTDNLFNKEKWNEKPPFIVSFQKPVFYNEFIDVSSYSQLNFSALLRDSETINGSNRDLLAIQFYDSNFNILSNTEILSPTNFSWSSFYKYWWSGSYFPINSQECYQANGTDTRKWYYNQWNTYDNTINIPSNVNYIRVSLNKLNESANENFLVLHPILKVTGERKPQKNTTLPLKNKEIPTSLNISIYPNPSNEYIKINFPDNVTGKFEYSIFTVSGKQIMQGNMNPKNRIDISTFSTGVYIVKVANEEYSFYNKFIKN